MSRRKKYMTNDDTLKFVLMVLFFIPVAIFFVIKWLAEFLAYISTPKPEKEKAYKASSYASTPRINASHVDMSAIDLMDGITFENLIADILRRNGYSNVWVTKASGDYGVDVIGTQSGRKWAFQCKCHCGKIGIQAVQEVYSGGRMYQAEKLAVVTNSVFTPNAINLARELGVELWDRQMLMQLIGQNQHLLEKHALMGKVALSENKTCTSEFDSRAMHRAIDTEIRTEAKTEQIQKITNILQTKIELSAEINDEQQNQKIEESEQKIQKEDKVHTAMATVLGAGTYIFGRNLPRGMYDLQAVSGSGWLIPFDRDGDEMTSMSFGTDGDRDARTYNGLCSDDVKKFVVEGNVKFTIKKSSMIEIE